MARLFGTDGIRGVAGDFLDAALALRTGAAAATVLTESTSHRPRIIIGKDTRISSDMLESALAAGITSVGGDVLLVGVVPTPAVAFLTVRLGADAGIMISASHNPFEHNGIKIFDANGYKLPDEMEDRIEKLITDGVPGKTGADIGRVYHEVNAAASYSEHVRSCAENDMSGLRVLIDCANGSASRTARDIFGGFAAQVDIISDAPNGVNINLDCGSTHLGALAERVKAGGYDVGIAFDGDADRCLAVNERGEPVDGDHIMAIVGRELMRRGRLAGDTIVATVMSNLGFHKFAQANGMKVIAAPVGDRYVLEEMRKGGFVLGGEQSGHLIFLDYTTTGDGQLTAVLFLGMLAASGKKLSELDNEIRQYPQILRNVTVPASVKHRLASAPEVVSATKEAEAMLGEGRILVRPSGTEALVRVMVEGIEADRVERACAHVVAAIESVKE